MQTMSSLNGTDVSNKPLNVIAMQQGHPIYWEKSNEQLPGTSFCQLHMYKAEEEPQN